MEEGKSGLVCITASGSIPENQDIEFSIISSDGTAQNELGIYQKHICMVTLAIIFITGNDLHAADYMGINVMEDVRDMENPLCLDVFSILDYLVEGDETYTISLSSNNQIVSINEPIIEITIKDRDCK